MLRRPWKTWLWGRTQTFFLNMDHCKNSKYSLVYSLNSKPSKMSNYHALSTENLSALYFRWIRYPKFHLAEWKRGTWGRLECRRWELDALCQEEVDHWCSSGGATIPYRNAKTGWDLEVSKSSNSFPFIQFNPVQFNTDTLNELINIDNNMISYIFLKLLPSFCASKHISAAPSFWKLRKPRYIALAPCCWACFQM